MVESVCVSGCVFMRVCECVDYKTRKGIMRRKEEILRV